MKDVIYLLFSLLTTLAKLLRPGGRSTVIAENLLLKQQPTRRQAISVKALQNVSWRQVRRV